MFKYLNLIGGMAVASLVFMLAVPAYAVESPPLPTPVGRVVWVKGILKAVMPNKEERTLQKTSVIYEHDELLTDENSQAQIVFTDNTLMTFRPSTKFYINHYQYSTTPDKKTHSVGKYVMDLVEGGFRTITGLIAKNNPSDYRVNTPVATIGVRGTDYTVYVMNGEIYVGYYAGTPCITGTGTTEQTLCLSATVPYATIPQGSFVPVPLNEQPAVFREKLEISIVKITPFASVNDNTNTRVIEYTKIPTGPITNFCITQ